MVNRLYIKTVQNTPENVDIYHEAMGRVKRQVIQKILLVAVKLFRSLSGIILVTKSVRLEVGFDS